MQEKTPRFSGKVLVAEDNPPDQKLMKLLLERIGLRVTIAADGSQALRMALSQNFDLIFMDIRMPDITGDQVAKAIRQHALETPIIAVTACAMAGDDQKCIEAGCNDYLAKPIDHKELIKTIAKYIPANKKVLN
ncbi:response regulator [Planctomycetota bacterium]